MKIGYQLKQVRERLAKGLVDKGVLRTEKRNFLLFDMATHPVSDPTFKEDVLRRTLGLLTARTAAVPTSNLYGEQVRYRTIRAVAMVCAAFAANVLENALVHLGYDAREGAFAKCDELLAEYSQWPFGAVRGGGGNGIGAGTSSAAAESANLAEINRLARGELGGEGGGEQQAQVELHMEIVAAVLSVYSRCVIPLLRAVISADPLPRHSFPPLHFSFSYLDFCLQDGLPHLIDLHGYALGQSSEVEVDMVCARERCR